MFLACMCAASIDTKSPVFEGLLADFDSLVDAQQICLKSASALMPVRMFLLLKDFNCAEL